MSSIERPLAGTPLLFDLRDGGSDLLPDGRPEPGRRIARTLVNNGPLRVTLVALGAGGSLASHRAPGPISVHVISGQVRFVTAEDEWLLKEGDLLALDGGVEHSVTTTVGGVFVLTVAAPSAP